MEINKSYTSNHCKEFVAKLSYKQKSIKYTKTEFISTLNTQIVSSNYNLQMT